MVSAIMPLIWPHLAAAGLSAKEVELLIANRIARCLPLRN
jgi:hypothetical protein